MIDPSKIFWLQWLQQFHKDWRDGDNNHNLKTPDGWRIQVQRERERERDRGREG